MKFSRVTCSLALVGLLICHQAQAAPPFCGKEYVPVCCIHGGVYSRTKTNLCLCHQYSGELLHEGECKGETTPPPEDLEPVTDDILPIVEEESPVTVEELPIVAEESPMAPEESPEAPEESPALWAPASPLF